MDSIDHITCSPGFCFEYVPRFIYDHMQQIGRAYIDDLFLDSISINIFLSSLTRPIQLRSLRMAT